MAWTDIRQLVIAQGHRRASFTLQARFVSLQGMMRPLGNNSPPAIEDGKSVITSRENRWLKRFRACLAGDARADGSVGVEGVRLVEAALGSGLPIEAILLSPSGRRHLPRLEGSIRPNARMLHTSDRLFAWIADTHSPQGIAALVRPKTSTIETLVGGVALTLVLVGVQDPGNVGTLVRAAEAFGATGVATCSAGALGSANPLMPKALRASAGSALRIPLVHGLPAEAVLAQLRAAGVKLYAAVRDSGPEENAEFEGKHASGPPMIRPWEADWKSRAALVIGNEGAGLPEEIVRTADACVSIPQSAMENCAGVESLNAAMAGTVLLYEAMRQRGGAKVDSWNKR